MNKTSSKSTKTVREIVIERAGELDITPAEIARQSGEISKQHIYAWWRGEKTINDTMLDAVLQVLGLRVRYGSEGPAASHHQ